jgi:hypothetical protein
MQAGHAYGERERQLRIAQPTRHQPPVVARTQQCVQAVCAHELVSDKRTREGREWRVPNEVPCRLDSLRAIRVRQGQPLSKQLHTRLGLSCSCAIPL